MTNEELKGCLLEVPEEQYHAEGRSGAWLQSHALALFRRSPAAYDRMRRGAAGAKDEPKDAFAFGRAAHCYVLEGVAEFARRYATDEARPVNPKTGKPFGSATKEYAAWAAGVGKEIVSASDFATIRAMAAAVAAHPVAAPLLRCGMAERVARTHYAGMNCQIRMDYVSAENGIADLKTCRDIDRFEWDALEYGYIWQLAFYRAVLRVVTLGWEAPCRIVAVEKAEPFRCGVWRVPAWALDHAEKVNEERMLRLARCIEADAWPEPEEWEAERLLDFRS